MDRAYTLAPVRPVNIRWLPQRGQWEQNQVYLKILSGGFAFQWAVGLHILTGTLGSSVWSVLAGCLLSEAMIAASINPS